jgi:hypothetical protein
MKRRRCQEWEETIWKEQQWWIQLSQIGILKKRKFVETVGIKI